MRSNKYKSKEHLVPSVKVVCVSDTHLCHTHFDVPDGDIFIHAGDLTQEGTLSELKVVSNWMRSLPHKHKIFIAGNHDFAFQKEPDKARALFDGLTYLEDSEITAEGLRIYGAPWQPRFFDWAFNVDRGKDIREKWEKIPEGLDILITHGPPFGIGDRARYGENVGCKDLLHFVNERKPKYHIFGHIHEARGMWEQKGVTYMNVASDYGRKGPVDILIDK